MPSRFSNIFLDLNQVVMLMTNDNTWRRVAVTSYGVFAVIGTASGEVFGHIGEARNAGATYFTSPNLPNPPFVVGPNSQLFAIAAVGTGRISLEVSDPIDVAYDLIG